MRAVLGSSSTTPIDLTSAYFTHHISSPLQPYTSLSPSTHRRRKQLNPLSRLLLPSLHPPQPVLITLQLNQILRPLHHLLLQPPPPPPIYLNDQHHLLETQSCCTLPYQPNPPLTPFPLAIAGDSLLSRAAPLQRPLPLNLRRTHPSLLHLRHP